MYSGAEIHSPTLIEKHSKFITWILPPSLYLINTIYIIIAGILIKDRRRNFFSIAIPFLG
jgi:hypothetical protein